MNPYKDINSAIISAVNQGYLDMTFIIVSSLATIGL